MSDRPKPSRPYQPPRLYDVGTADERAFGATVMCSNGGTNLSGTCHQGSRAAPGQCQNGAQAGAGACNNGAQASSRCANGGHGPAAGLFGRQRR
jgi:hypothetical protein